MPKPSCSGLKLTLTVKFLFRRRIVAALLFLRAERSYLEEDEELPPLPPKSKRINPLPGPLGQLAKGMAEADHYKLGGSAPPVGSPITGSSSWSSSGSPPPAARLLQAPAVLRLLLQRRRPRHPAAAGQRFSESPTPLQSPAGSAAAVQGTTGTSQPSQPTRTLRPASGASNPVTLNLIITEFDY